jgi:hypothetical protein
MELGNRVIKAEVQSTYEILLNEIKNIQKRQDVANGRLLKLETSHDCLNEKTKFAQFVQKNWHITLIILAVFIILVTGLGLENILKLLKP